MTRVFVDTNLFLRYLTNDDPTKADRVEQLLNQAAAGEVRLVTAEMVLAETVWVLESSYGLGRAQVAPLVRGILATPGLEVVNGSLVARALDHYETLNVDFVDGYIAAVMEKQGIDELYSFDKKHASRLKGVRRREP
ncbi:MAG: type II toxin-antitoxin system VapC family toxin [Thermodesulfobacteriota bacterium]